MANKKEEAGYFVDLFCGCGGFSYGLEQAGFQCLLGVDFNHDATESFKLNHPGAQAYCGDIRELTEKKIKSYLGNKKIDLVVGGPPCQGFSTVGRGQVNDERNNLFQEFVRVVACLKPEFILFENVTGIVAKKNSAILKNIFKQFEGLGYDLSAKVLRSERYGVPSRRRRTFIIGSKNFSPDRLFPNEELDEKSLCSVESAFRVLKSKRHLNHEVEKVLIKNKIDAQRLKHIPDGAGIRYQRDEKKYLPKKLHFGINWEEIRENRFRQTKLQRLALKQPAPTILTSRTTYYHPTEIRYLTPREAALLQSFPVDFNFYGSITSNFRQIGNAVPPLLAKKIGHQIRLVQAEKKISKAKNKKKRQDFEKIRSTAFIYKIPKDPYDGKDSIS